MLLESRIRVVNMKLNKDRWGSLGICVTSLLLWLSHYSNVTFMLANQPVHHIPRSSTSSLFFTTREWSAWRISSFLFKLFPHCAPEEISFVNLNVSWLVQKTQARVSQQVLLLNSHENNALCLSVASRRVIIKVLLDVTGRIKHTKTPGTDKSSKNTPVEIMLGCPQWSDGCLYYLM